MDLYTEPYIDHNGRMIDSSASDTIRAGDLVVALRCVLGLPPLDRPPTDDIPAHVPAELEVEGVNARWLIAWTVAGLELFARAEVPTMAATTIAARRTVANLAMDATCGRLTVAARLLCSGRGNVRRTLEEAGCYPWRDPMDRHPPIHPVPWCRCADGSDGHPDDQGEYDAA